jgi:AraC-like DNA-binding protein
MHSAAPPSLIAGDAAAGPIACSIRHDEFDVDLPWHHHDMHQIQYAIEGSLEVEDTKRRSLLPRQLAAWIPAGVTHRTSLHRMRSLSVLLAPHLVPDAGSSVRIILVSPLMREMLQGALRWRIGEQFDAVGEAYFTTFALLCREWIEHEAPLSLPTTTEPHLQAALDHTRANLANATIASAADAAHISARTLRRRFDDLGVTWDEYRRHCRLLAAIDLLSSTVLPIGEIADRVGYLNQSAFAAAFQAQLGVSPTAYRRQIA